MVWTAEFSGYRKNSAVFGFLARNQLIDLGFGTISG
jgi:hypothetical protein